MDKKSAVFKGAVALDDSANVIFGTAHFEVYGDGKRLWQSSPMNKTRVTQDFNLDVTGVTALELRVVPERSSHGLHAVWMEPRLLQRSNTPDK